MQRQPLKEQISRIFAFIMSYFTCSEIYPNLVYCFNFSFQLGILTRVTIPSASKQVNFCSWMPQMKQKNFGAGKMAGQKKMHFVKEFI